MSRDQLLILLGVAGLALPLAALVPDAIPVPKAPYIVPVPDFAHWTVKIKPPASPSTSAQQSAAPAPPVDTGLPVMLDTVKTGDVSRVSVYYRGAAPEVFNEKGGTVFVPTQKSVMMLHDEDASMQSYGPEPPDPNAGFKGPYPYYSRGFLYADFLYHKGLSSFKDVVLHNSVRCFHYQDGDYEAWIDVETMLPVATKHGGIEADFQFLPAPTSPLELPPEEAASIQKSEETYKVLRSIR